MHISAEQPVTTELQPQSKAQFGHALQRGIKTNKLSTIDVILLAKSDLPPPSA